MAPRVVVTGGNRGIGFAVAHDLAARGCHVIVVARNEEAGTAAARDLAKNAPGRVELAVGDLSTPRTTRALAERLTMRAPIDVLIHNAGIWPSGLERDERGIERAFAVNHLAPFLLNQLLADAIPRGGRVIQVSADLYIKGKVDIDRTPYGADFHPLRTYANTKLCNLLLLHRFAQRLSGRGITINAVHPGVIRTGLGDRAGALGLLVRAVKLTWGTPAEGARPIVRLALDPVRVTGRYFHLLEEMPLADVARDDALAERLWQRTETLCGLRPAAHHASADARTL